MTFASLRAYAKHVLEGGWQPELDLMHVDARGWSEIVLHRAGRLQTVLVVFQPGVHVPMHRHNRLESLDCFVGGSGDITILPRIVGRRIDRLRGPILHSLMRVPRGAWHGGHSFERGAAFLSFGRWEGEPCAISEDWEAWSHDKT